MQLHSLSFSLLLTPTSSSPSIDPLLNLSFSQNFFSISKHISHTHSLHSNTLTSTPPPSEIISVFSVCQSSKQLHGLEIFHLNCMQFPELLPQISRFLNLKHPGHMALLRSVKLAPRDGCFALLSWGEDQSMLPCQVCPLLGTSGPYVHVHCVE